MRDTNLNYDYFLKALKKKVKFINGYEEMVSQDENEKRNPNRYYYLRKWYYDQFILEYSMGMFQFSFSWPRYFKAFLNMSPDLINYNTLLQSIALGVLFQAPLEELLKIKEKAIERREYDDALRLLTSLDPNETSQMRAIIPENNDLIQGMETKNPQFIMNYLNSWYRSNEGEYWHGEHTDPEGLAYIGYWCIEAAAAVKKFNIPYDLIRNHKYFPVDMVEM
ncbi:PoNe immunity protein domain-containing protein [Halocola ammonii]